MATVVSPHPHLHLIRRAAELAQETTEVGMHFRWRRDSNDAWSTFPEGTGVPNFHPEIQYEEIPEYRLMHAVNVPRSPIRKRPQLGQRIYYARLVNMSFVPTQQNRHPKVINTLWHGTTLNKRLFEHGCLFHTEEEAAAHHDAIFLLTNEGREMP